jgi:hypothetical protein
VEKEPKHVERGVDAGRQVVTIVLPKVPVTVLGGRLLVTLVLKAKSGTAVKPEPILVFQGKSGITVRRGVILDMFAVVRKILVQSQRVILVGNVRLGMSHVQTRPAGNALAVL